MDAMFTIRPPPRSISNGIAARAQRKTPFTLTAKMRSQTASSIAATGAARSSPEASRYGVTPSPDRATSDHVAAGAGERHRDGAPDPARPVTRATFPVSSTPGDICRRGARGPAPAMLRSDEVARHPVGLYEGGSRTAADSLENAPGDPEGVLRRGGEQELLRRGVAELRHAVGCQPTGPYAGGSLGPPAPRAHPGQCPAHAGRRHPLPGEQGHRAAL